MIRRYFQNTDVNMTKETYFEMCEMLGNEPIEEEIPVEYEDFPETVQLCLTIYTLLQDNWDPMGGNYLGKDYSLLFKFLELYQIPQEEHLLAMGFMQSMDNVRTKLISDKIKAKAPSTKK